MNIGLIGLGAMGLGMAQSLRRAGHVVHAFDLRQQVVQDFVAGGGVACASPAEVAAGCEVLVSVVVNLAQTEAVLFGPGGAAAAMRPGSVFVMSSTIAPDASRALEQRLAALGLVYLDARVSGGAANAAEGRLTVIAGGSAAAHDKAAPALQAMASQVYRVGEQAGSGSTVKLINQLLVSVHMAAAAEALALGARQGVDLQALYQVITHSFGNSVCFEQRAHHVLSGDYTPTSAVEILVKDLGLVLDAGRAASFPLPLSATAHQMFLQAVAAGHGREATMAVVKIFPGIRLPGSDPDEGSA